MATDPITGTRSRVSVDGSLHTHPHAAGATPVVASSGVVANAAAAASIAAVADKTSYLSGFQCMALGVTTGPVTVQVTVAGLAGGTMTYLMTVQTGVAVAGNPYPLNVAFDPPLKASAPAVPITVTMPALGAGNTTAITNAQGFQL